MFDRLFPKQLDNRFEGSRLAIWLLIPIVLLKAIIGFNSMMFPRAIAMTADAIPLDRFAPDAAQTVVSLFALLGLFHLLFAALGAVVVIRYRAMIPFLYLAFIIQQLGNRVLLIANPVVRSGPASSGSAVVFAILAMTVIGFMLSLVRRSNSQFR